MGVMALGFTTVITLNYDTFWLVLIDTSGCGWMEVNKRRLSDFATPCLRTASNLITKVTIINWYFEEWKKKTENKSSLFFFFFTLHQGKVSTFTNIGFFFDFQIKLPRYIVTFQLTSLASYTRSWRKESPPHTYVHDPARYSSPEWKKKYEEI